MPQSLCSMFLHLVFSTKNRVHFLTDAVIRDSMWEYMAGICRNLGCKPVAVGGTSDHAHVLCLLSRTVDVSTFDREVKRGSSKWIKQEGGMLSKFSWQAGYGAFSISPNHARSLQGYIANQVEHHRNETFQEEFRRLLKKYEISCDEPYVWD